MPLQRYDMNASDACVSYADINGNWCNARDVVELEESYAKLEETNAELMNHLKSWLSEVRPVTGKELYYITNEFMEDICRSAVASSMVISALTRPPGLELPSSAGTSSIRTFSGFSQSMSMMVFRRITAVLTPAGSTKVP